MRVEDLDAPRTRPEAVAGNLAELAWLGFDWDEGPDVGGPYAPYLQSERADAYETALQRLREGGHLFECYLSRREIVEVSAGSGGVDAAGEGGSEQPSRVYGPKHRALNEQLAPGRRAAGSVPSLRFRVPRGSVTFDDAVQGEVSFDLASEVGDFVVRRADGQVSYQLAVVVDDAAMEVSEVARGADLLSSTAAQSLLYSALGSRRPGFAHVGLLLSGTGEKLSKRDGPLSLHELRDAGADPRSVLGLLAHSLGWLDARGPVTPEQLLARLRDGPLSVPPGDLALNALDLAAL